MKKLISFILVLAICLGAFSFTVNAAKEADLFITAKATSGTWGSNVSWNFNTSTKVLRVSGTGAMDDFPSSSTSAWRVHKSSIKTVVIEDGVTSIGSYAFASFSSLTSITIPDSVNHIGYFALELCSSLKSITIPDSVTSMPGGAFRYCRSLTNITIPKGVKNIGSYTFEYCTGLTSITIPKGVTSIGSISFHGCNSLTSITIPDSVISIGACAFDDCSSLTSIIIPDGVTNIAYRVFYGCSSLKNITIPEGVTSISKDAFLDCDKLSTVYYDGTKSQWVGISIDEGNEALTGAKLVVRPSLPISGYWGSLKWTVGTDKKLTISGSGDMLATSALVSAYPWSEYSSIIETVVVDNGITSVSDGAFSGLTNLKYVLLGNTVATVGKNAFEGCTALTAITLPNSTKTVEAFAFKGCSKLENAVIHEGLSSIGESAFMGTKLSKVMFSGTSFAWKAIAVNSINVELSKAEIVCFDGTTGTGTATIGQPFFNYDLSNHTGVAGKTETINVTCNGEDALAGKLYYQAGTREAMNFTVSVTDTEKTVSEYQVLKVYSTAKSDRAVFKKFAKQAFTLYPSDFAEGEKIYIRVKYTDGNYSAIAETSVCIYASADIDINFDDLVNIQLPESIPVIGGTEIAITQDVFPVSVMYSDGTYKIAIGVELGENDNGNAKINNWKSISNQVESASSDVEDGTKILKKLMDKGVKWHETSLGIKAMACGYAEFAIKEGKPNLIAGKVLFGFSGAVKNEWQTALWVVPVVINVTFSASATASVAVRYDEANGKFSYLGNVSFVLPAIRVSAGPGIANIADVSAYGEAKNIINLSLLENGPVTTATLTGSFGVSAKALFWSAEWEIWKSEGWEYYNSSKGTSAVKKAVYAAKLEQAKQNINKIYNSDNYAIRRVTTKSAWLGGAAPLGTDAGYEMVNAVTLQEGITDLSVPQLITTEDGLKMLVWVADIPERTTGNHSAVVFSVYDEESSAWSAPIIVEDDGTADFMPQLATDGTEIYVVWADASEFMDETDTLNESATLCEISVAKFDRITGAFGTAVTLTNDNCFDANPAVTVIDGTAHIAWISCSGTEILTMEGTNSVYYATVNDEGYEVSLFAAYEKPITKVAIGAFGNSVAIAFPLDGDGDILTAEDTEVYVSAVGGTATAITANTTIESGIKFATIGGIDMLLWHCDGAIYAYDGTEATVIIDDAGLSAEYFHVEGGGRSAILCNVTEEGNARLVAYTYTDGKWNAPVDIASAPGYIRKATGYIDEGGNFNIVFVRTDAIISNGSVTESHDLCISSVTANCAFAVGEIEIDHSLVVPGATLDLNIPVTNNGLLSADSFVVTVYDENGAVYAQSVVAQKVASGATANLPFGLVLPETVEGKKDYTITVFPAEGTEMDESDNTARVAIGYTDLGLTSVATNADVTASAIRFTVTNTSCVDTDAILNIYRSGEEDVALWSCYIENITSGSETSYEIYADTVRTFANDGDILVLKLTAIADEITIYDNEDTAVVSIDLRTWLAVEDDIYAELDFSGKPYIGSKISIVTDNIDCSDPTVEYVWYRDDDIIDGANEATYTLTTSDFGHNIRGAVKGTGDYAGELVTSLIPIEESRNSSDGIMRFMPKTQVAEEIEGSAETLRFSLDDCTLQTGDYVFTGVNVLVYNANNGLTQRLTAVVMGDNDSDGILSATDLLVLRRHIQGRNKLNSVCSLASDFNMDDVVSTVDYLVMRKQLVEE